MKYVLNLAEDGRILSATFEKFANEKALLVTTIPEGDISDYKYVDGQYVYDPLPKPNLPKPTASLQDQIEALKVQNDFLEDCIAEMAGIVYA